MNGYINVNTVDIALNEKMNRQTDQLDLISQPNHQPTHTPTQIQTQT